MLITDILYFLWSLQTFPFTSIYPSVPLQTFPFTSIYPSVPLQTNSFLFEDVLSIKPPQDTVTFQIGSS